MQYIIVKWLSIFLVLIYLVGCATQSVEVQAEDVLKEYHPQIMVGYTFLDGLEEKDLWLLLSEAYENHDYDKGLAIAVRLLDFSLEKDIVYHEIGYLLTQKQHYDLAIAMYQQAINVNPYSHISYYNLAEIYLTKNKILQAKPILQRALTLDSDNYQYMIQIAKVNMMLKNYDQALEYYMEVVEQINAGHINMEYIPATRYEMYADVFYDLALLHLQSKQDAEQANNYLDTYDTLKPNDNEAKMLRWQIAMIKS